MVVGVIRVYLPAKTDLGVVGLGSEMYLEVHHFPGGKY